MRGSTCQALLSWGTVLNIKKKTQKNFLPESDILVKVEHKYADKYMERLPGGAHSKEND